MLDREENSAYLKALKSRDRVRKGLQDRWNTVVMSKEREQDGLWDSEGKRSVAMIPLHPEIPGSNRSEGWLIYAHGKGEVRDEKSG